ncbi:MAG: hypothetical protein DWP97_09790 [Calditrichaeota bacterium]|nr:MAG: hypothetical protein DWP97_09790 [Calditrichota bacterium]
MIHKNSQKRIIVPNAIYFVTTNTYNKFQYFKNVRITHQLIKDIWYVQRVKSFELFGYKINPDHIHILIQPKVENISECMRSLKTNSSRNINKLIISELEQMSSSNLKARSRDRAFKVDKVFLSIPPFKWQKSYIDHIIRGEQDFIQHLKYLQNQSVKHNLTENKYLYINPNVF